jgi:hypothetical protein
MAKKGREKSLKVVSEAFSEAISVFPDTTYGCRTHYYK